MRRKEPDAPTRMHAEMDRRGWIVMGGQGDRHLDDEVPATDRWGVFRGIAGLLPYGLVRVPNRPLRWRK